MTFKETIGLNGIVITIVWWKAGSLPRRSPSLELLCLLRFFWPKMKFRGLIFEPVENRTSVPQNILWIGYRLDPPKMVPGREFGKNIKIRWSIDTKIRCFWWLGTTLGVISFAYFKLSVFSKKKRWKKVDAKRDAQTGCPKSLILYIFIYRYIYICIHIYIYIYIYSYIFIYTYIFILIYIYIFIYLLIY